MSVSRPRYGNGGAIQDDAKSVLGGYTAVLWPMPRERSKGGERQPLSDGKQMDADEEQEIMTAMRVAGWDSKQIRAMTYTSWKDGIDIERPRTALVAFARLIRSGLTKTAA